MRKKQSLKTQPTAETPLATNTGGQLSVDAVADQVDKVQELMLRVMKKDLDYGVIPGTERPSLLKPGAEKLSFLFNYIPTVELEQVDHDNGHREFHAKVILHHRYTGEHVGDGVASASTLESRYRWRKAGRICPRCNQESIIKGKEEYGGGWICWKSKGGCGEKYDTEDAAISSQQVGKIENPDIADVYNTVKKISKKRALIDAILTATGASSLFTQDVEDFAGRAQPPEKEEANGPANAEPPMDRKATDKQIKMIRGKIGAKAKSSGIPAEEITQHVLNQLGIESSKGLLMKDIDAAIEIVANVDKPQQDGTPF